MISPQRLLAIGMLLIVGYSSITLPYANVWVLAIAGVISSLVFWRIGMMFLFLPVIVPAMDLTPWTGRCYFTEFDIWILAAIAPYLWNARFSNQRHVRTLDFLLLAGLTVSFMASVIVAWTHAGSFASTEFGNIYDHPLNALRVARPTIYGVLVWWILARSEMPRGKAFRLFSLGTVIGLAMVVVVVALERHRFSGVFNLSSPFRVTGPFSDMHTGGAYLDVYLIASIPLIACVWRRTTSITMRFCLGLVLLGSVAAIFATLSRAPIIILGIQAILFACWSFRSPTTNLSTPTLSKRFSKLAMGVLVVSLIAAAVVAIEPIRSRFEKISDAWSQRVNHWNQTLALLDDGWLERLLGVGCGGYPRTLREHDSAGVLGDYQFRSERGHTYLRLTGSQPIYFGQYVSIEPNTAYSVVVEGRRMSDSGSLTVFLCEKNLLESFEKVALSGLFADAAVGEWTTVERSLDSQQVGKPVKLTPGMPAVHRPIVLGFSSSSGSVIDLDSIRLMDSRGVELVDNYDFDQKHDRWWWTSDCHLSWHAKNLYLHLLIEQGWIGLFALAAVGMRSICWLISRNSDNADAALLACSILGFLMIGMIDSLIDSPKIAFLFFLLIGFAMCDRWANTDRIESC